MEVIRLDKPRGTSLTLVGYTASVSET